jgi:D-alanyl-D-alanine carboxypeptidase
LRSLYGPVLRTSYNTAILLALVLMLQGVAATGALAEPGVGARSWVLADAESGKYLAGENAS